MVQYPIAWKGAIRESKCMKAIVSLIGLGLFLLLGAVGCEEEHEHHHGGPYGGTYEGPYYNGHGYGAYPDDGWHHHD